MDCGDLDDRSIVPEGQENPFVEPLRTSPDLSTPEGWHDFSLVLGGPLFQLLRKARLEGGEDYSLLRWSHGCRCCSWRASAPQLATAAPLLPLLLTIFSPEELVMRVIKVVF